MIYLPELYYFFDEKSVEFPKAIQITAGHISRTASYYEAEILYPLKGAKKEARSGDLTGTPAEREAVISEIFTWIQTNTNSATPDLFKVIIGNDPSNPDSTFSHYDDNCCWALNLTRSEFTDLQQTWKDHGLPTDLFYSETETICKIKPPGPLRTFLANFGISWESKSCFSPKRWQAEKIKQEKQKNIKKMY